MGMSLNSPSQNFPVNHGGHLHVKFEGSLRPSMQVAWLRHGWLLHGKIFSERKKPLLMKLS